MLLLYFIISFIVTTYFIISEPIALIEGAKWQMTNDERIQCGSKWNYLKLRNRVRIKYYIGYWNWTWFAEHWGKIETNYARFNITYIQTWNANKLVRNEEISKYLGQRRCQRSLVTNNKGKRKKNKNKN